MTMNFNLHVATKPTLVSKSIILRTGNMFLIATALTGVLTVPAQAIQSPDSITVKPISTNQVEVTWRDRSTSEDKFDIFRSQAGGAFVFIGSVPANGTKFLDSGLTASTQYSYRVDAVDAAVSKVVTTLTMADTVLPPPPPPPPVGTVYNVAMNPSTYGWPDASNTGPAPGTVFIKVPEQKTSGPGWEYEASFGRIRITGPGTVLSGIETRLPVVIDAPNVTVTNSRIIVPSGYQVVAVRAGRPIDGYNADNATITHNYLGSEGATRAERAVSDVYGGAKGLIVTHNDISGVSSNGITVEGTANVYFNYIHDFGYVDGFHQSGISTHGGGTDIAIDRNTVLLNSPGVSGCITVYSDFHAASNVRITNNLVSGGSYAIYGGDSGSFAPAAGGIVIQNNRFSKIYGQNGKAGYYGQIAAYSPAPGEFSGNVWDDTGVLLP